MPRSSLLLLLAAFCSPARAEVTQADLLARGYRPIAHTTLPGLFTGCHKAQALAFANGMHFTCTAARHAAAAFPPVRLLRGPDGTYAALIGGAFYQGVVDLADARERSRALSADLVEETLPQPLSAEPSGDNVIAVEPVDSIGELRDDDHLRLNDAQRFIPARRQSREPP